MSSKSKKRVVLPSRPDPPSVEQILEDLGKATPNDPVFSVLQDAPQDRAADSVVESRYQQSQRYLELNERLQQAKGELATKRDELCLAGERLEQSVAEEPYPRKNTSQNWNLDAFPKQDNICDCESTQSPESGLLRKC